MANAAQPGGIPVQGDTKQAVVADEQGRFDVPGRYNITLYPVARGPDHPARFTGSTDGHLMTLTVTLTDTAVKARPVQPQPREEAPEGPGPLCPQPNSPPPAGGAGGLPPRPPRGLAR